MRQKLAIALAALTLTAALTGCSGGAYVESEPQRTYSNVSTTQNGTVNGTNPTTKKAGTATTGTNKTYASAKITTASKSSSNANRTATSAAGQNN